MDYKLIFLFDGGCPLCLRETNFLKTKDTKKFINFVDININYIPEDFKNISYKKAMAIFMGF